MFQRVGLLHEIRFPVDDFGVENGLAGVAGNEQEFRLRSQPERVLRQSTLNSLPNQLPSEAASPQVAFARRSF